MQTLDAQGQVVESCRSTTSAPRPRRDRRPARTTEGDAPDEPRGGFAFDLTARGGVMLGLAPGASVALPAFAATLAAGGVGANGIGAMGLLNFDVGTTLGFTGVAATLAPALRLGRTSHVSLGLGPSLLVFDSVVGGGSGFVLSALLHGVVQLVSGFSLALSANAHFEASAVLFFLSVGLGFSTPH